MTASSLREFDRPADRIRQHRQTSTAPIVVVEGPDDFLVLRPHLSEVDVFPVDGKTNVIATARALVAWGIGGFVCVFDRDFDDIEDLSDIAPVLCPYSGADLEAMLIELGVLSLVLQHQGSQQKLADLGGTEAVIAQIISDIQPVSRLRLESRAQRWDLAFDRVDLTSKVDRRTLKVEIIGYCAALTHVSGVSVPTSDLIAVAESEESPEHYRGKDALAVAGVGLRIRFGSLQAAACATDVLVGQLHSSAGLAIAKSAWLAELTSRVAAARN